MYKDDPCTCFKLKGTDRPESDEMQMNLRIHKAISIIQFKVEGQIIERQKGFHLENRALLHKIDYQKGTINLEGKEYKLLDTNFPTIDPKNPYKLTSEEDEIMDRLVHAFVGCEKLQEHMRFLLAKGGLYKVYNNNLLYHGCVPLDAKGNLKEVEIFGKKYRGKDLYDVLEKDFLHWIQRSGKMEKIQCGISGYIRTHRYLERTRWLPLKDISLQRRKHI